MKLKSLLFGSAAAMAAVTGAQAADMPMAEPVEYVRVCDAFGTGFFYIPGTDTCLKISGYVRVEAYWQSDADDDADPTYSVTNVVVDDGADNYLGIAGIPTQANASEDNFTTFARGALSVDARKMTDLGLLRTAFQYFMNVNAEFDASEDNGAGTSLDFAFIQLSNDLGTLTVGHTGSFFNYKGSGTLEGVGANDANTTLIGYSFNIGNGASLSLALEDSNSGGRNGGIAHDDEFYNDDENDFDPCDTAFDDYLGDTDNAYCFSDHDGDQVPDLVANIRLDQAWGSVQLMGALHQVRGNFSAVEFEDQIGGTPGIVFENQFVAHDDDWGWAVGAGAEMSSGAFSAFIQAFYGEGVGNYFWDPVSGAPTPEGFMSSTGNLLLPEMWYVNGAITASLSSSITAVVAASYGEFDAPSGFTDYDEWAIAGDLLWSPVSGMTIGLGIVHWENDVHGGANTDGTKGRIRFQSSF